MTVNSEVIIGRWGGWSPGTLHKIVVDGGELETVGDVIRVGYDTCYGELWLNDGVLSPRGLDIRYRWDNGNGMTVTNTVSRELFVMNGGTLNLGQLGFNTQRAIPICPAAWLGGGTVRNRHPSNDEGAGWSLRHKYLHMAFETWGRFEGPQSVEPNMLVIDLDGKKSDFRTAIQGNGNVTLKGGGEFTADVDVKGVTFSNSPANALAGLGKIKVAFDAKPTRSRYMVGPALGLTGAEEVGVEATYIDAGVVKPYPDVKLRVENGVLYLANTKPAGLTIMMR